MPESSRQGIDAVAVCHVLDLPRSIWFVKPPQNLTNRPVLCGVGAGEILAEIGSRGAKLRCVSSLSGYSKIAS